MNRNESRLTYLTDNSCKSILTLTAKVVSCVGAFASILTGASITMRRRCRNEVNN